MWKTIQVVDASSQIPVDLTGWSIKAFGKPIREETAQEIAYKEKESGKVSGYLDVWIVPSVDYEVEVIIHRPADKEAHSTGAISFRRPVPTRLKRGE